MSLETGKKYGYIASVINSILPILSIIMVIFMFTQLFQSIGYMLDNPGASNVPPTFGALNTAILTPLSTVAGVLGLVALILIFIAHYELSKYYNEPAIFKKLVYSIILTIAYVVIAIVVAVIFVIALVGTAVTTNLVPDMGTTMSTPIMLVGVLVFVVMTVIFVILYGLLWYRAFNKLGEKSGINNFKTAGLFFLIGSFIPFLSWVAWILAAQGYKQLKPQQPLNNNNDTQTYTQQPSQTFANIYCSQCGTENPTNSIYCKNCGQTITQLTQTNTTT